MRVTRAVRLGIVGSVVVLALATLSGASPVVDLFDDLLLDVTTATFPLLPDSQITAAGVLPPARLRLRIGVWP